MTRGIFRYTRWDALCVAVIPFQMAGYVLLAASFDALSAGWLVAVLPVLLGLSLQASGANHNHYHTPFFTIGWLNTLARVGFSAIGSPKTPHNIGHGIHHSTPQSWNDASILKILGFKRPVHKQLLALLVCIPESIGAKYLAMVVLLERWPAERLAAFAAPDEPQDLAIKFFRRIVQPASLRATRQDVAAWVGFRLVLLAISWKFFFLYFVPAMYVIECLRRGENYFQHWGASDPEDPMRDSVSSYGWFYNALTFNLGHHQEHHFRPGAHWTRLPAIAAELPRERRIVRFNHYFNCPLFFPSLARDLKQRVPAHAPTATPN